MVGQAAMCAPDAPSSRMPVCVRTLEGGEVHTLRLGGRSGWFWCPFGLTWLPVKWE